GKKFSYPGYSEIITGLTDPRIDSNGKFPNPNMTVFEWLNNRGGTKGRVAVIGNWDVFAHIFNCERAQLPLWPAWEPKFAALEIKMPAAIENFRRDTTALWPDMTYDSLFVQAAEDYLRVRRPRLLFVGFSETDEWAHEKRYDHYLHAAHHMDDFVRRLWDLAQSIPQYRDKTTFIITADHGRGNGPEWTSHGEKINGAENDWLAVIGPDTPPLGERGNTVPHTHSQIAATIAALFGESYQAAYPNVGKAMYELLGRPAN
ncbi:MAG TPA: sulfatase-like hydrolase/transferase, partial [Verrucomicrobiae bacterium]|nr:sulfatase-like hydrolase/transferase [Verrucomicrobiae bacterium]